MVNQCKTDRLNNISMSTVIRLYPFPHNCPVNFSVNSFYDQLFVVFVLLFNFVGYS